MADENTTINEEEKRQDAYVSPYEDILREQEQRLSRQEADDAERVKRLSRGRDYWVGANMFANAIGNLINVNGTVNGAPAMQMPDMDNSYMKVWKESDEIRRANRQRMKEHYDRLRVAKIQDEASWNRELNRRDYADTKEEKRIQTAADSYKTQWGSMFPDITDDQYRAWAQFGDSHMPLAIKKYLESEADNRKLNIDKQSYNNRAAFQKSLNKEETQRIADMYKKAYAEWDITDDEALAMANKIIPPRIAKLAAENNVTIPNPGSKRGTVSYGGTKKDEEYNIYVGDFIIKGTNKNQYSSNLGKLKSAVLKAIQNTEYYKGLREYVDKERDEYTQAKAMKWSDDDLSQFIDYFNLLDDPEFVKTLKGMAGVEDEAPANKENNDPNVFFDE